MGVGLLIIDDEQMICRGLKHIIEQVRGDQIDWIRTTTSPRDAICIAAAELPDVVITDIKMDEMSGLELIQRMRREAAPLAQYIVVSGYDDFHLVREALQLHAIDYLIKPAKTADLTNAISDAAERAAAEKRERRDNAATKADLRQSFLAELLTQFVANRPPARQTIGRMGRVLADHAPLSGVQCGFIETADPDRDVVPLLRAATSQTEPSELVVTTTPTAGPVIAFAVASTAENVKLVFDAFEKHLRAIIRRANEETGHRIVATLSSVAGDVALFGSIFVEGNDARILKLFEEAPVLRWPLPGPRLSEKTTRQWRVDLAQRFRNMQFDAVQETLDTLFSDTGLQDAGPLGVSQLIELVEDVVREEADSTCDLRRAFDGWELREMARACFQNAYDRQQPDHHSLRARVESYVMRHLDGNLTMQLVAESVGLSYSYFSSLFKQTVGLSFSDYLLQVRMDEARRMLQAGHLTIQEISFRVGYRSAKHFSRVFRGYFGMTPSQARTR